MPTAPHTPPAPQAPPVTHYENFPVASWLCPAPLRPAVAAIYHFARTADDIADEGDAPAAQRLADLSAYRAELHALATASSHQPPAASRWPQVFGPLAAQMRAFQLPEAPLLDLLSAFEQDVRMTHAGAAYPDQAGVLEHVLGELLQGGESVGKCGSFGHGRGVGAGKSLS